MAASRYQGLSPSIYHINEHADTFQLDVSHEIKATTLSAGMRFETGKLDEALKIDQFPGEPVEEKITNQQGTSVRHVQWPFFQRNVAEKEPDGFFRPFLLARE